MTNSELDPAVLSRLPSLDLIARQVVEGYITGLHKSPYHGFSAEFSEYRPYHPGAPLKHVDWRVLGRTERYYIKTFEEETNLRAILAVDASASMGYRSGTISKQQYAVWLAASMALLLLRQRDAVGLGIYDEKLRTLIRPRSAMSHLNTLLTALQSLENRGKTRTAEVLQSMVEQIHRRSLVCIFSDLMEPPEPLIKALKNFRIRGHEIIVFHILDPLEKTMAINRDAVLVDMETGTRLPVDTRQISSSYRQKIAAWTELLRHACLDMRSDYIAMDTTLPFHRALSAFLAKRKRMGG